MCLDPEPDKTAPYIVSYDPDNGNFIRFNSTQEELTIYINEPSECKYSLIDKNYEEMENSFECVKEPSLGTIRGWPCQTTLTNLENAENKFYIKCKDNPYSLEEERNANTQSFVYTLISSSSELQIDSIKPEGLISRGTIPITIDLEVTTSGGAENGKSICFYNWLGRDVEFFETNSEDGKHLQEDLNLFSGKYNLPINCVDVAGNTANAIANFTIEVDQEEPRIVRVYNLGDDIKILTNEEATCFYSLDESRECEFALQTSTEKGVYSMTNVISKEHNANFVSGRTMYIKCKDLWENSPAQGCSIKVFPST
jgi:hypothetical protein